MPTIDENAKAVQRLLCDNFLTTFDTTLTTAKQMIRMADSKIEEIRQRILDLKNILRITNVEAMKAIAKAVIAAVNSVLDKFAISTPDLSACEEFFNIKWVGKPFDFLGKLIKKIKDLVKEVVEKIAGALSFAYAYPLDFDVDEFSIAKKVESFIKLLDRLLECFTSICKGLKTLEGQVGTLFTTDFEQVIEDKAKQLEDTISSSYLNDSGHIDVFKSLGNLGLTADEVKTVQIGWDTSTQIDKKVKQVATSICEKIGVLGSMIGVSDLMENHISTPTVTCNSNIFDTIYGTTGNSLPFSSELQATFTNLFKSSSLNDKTTGLGVLTVSISVDSCEVREYTDPKIVCKSAYTSTVSIEIGGVYKTASSNYTQGASVCSQCGQYKNIGFTDMSSDNKVRNSENIRMSIYNALNSAFNMFTFSEIESRLNDPGNFDLAKLL